MHPVQRKAVTFFILSMISVSSIGFLWFWTVSDSLLIQNPLAIDSNIDSNTEPFQPNADATFQNPNTTVYPQYRFEYPPTKTIVMNGRVTEPTPDVTGYNRSDDVYSVLSTDNDTGGSTYRTLENFFYINWVIIPKQEWLIQFRAFGLEWRGTYVIPAPIWDSIGMLYFYFRISPELSTYISTDGVNDTHGYLVNQSYTENFYGKMVAANSPWMTPHPDSCYTFSANQSVTSLDFEAYTGGLKFFNDTLSNFYWTLWRAKAMVDGLENKQFTLLNYFVNYVKTLIAPGTEDFLTVVNDLTVAYWMTQNPIIYDFFKYFNPTYAMFLDFIGVDVTRGFQSYIQFDPYAVTRIDAKVQLYIDLPQDDPTMPQLIDYRVQLWNYFTGSWNDVLVRRNQPPMQLSNVWLYDDFYVDTNCWQYCHPVYAGQGESDSLKWRVVVDTTRLSGDTGNITVRFGGIWSSFTQEFIDFSWSAEFKVANDDVTVFDLLADPVFYLEYHTDGWQSPYEGVTVSKPVSSFFEMLYGFQQFVEDLVGDLDYYVELLTNEGWQSLIDTVVEKYALSPYTDIILDPFNKIGNMPSRDERIAYSVNRMFVSYDTWTRIGINGRFAKYSPDGLIRDPKLYVDKIAMQYEYKRPMNVSSTTYIDNTRLDYAYSAFDFEATEDMVNLELPLPQEYEFLGRYFSLVESPRSVNISSYWWDSLRTDPFTGEFMEEPMFENNTVHFTPKVFFFEGVGLYRTWCRIPNFATNVTVTNSTGGFYNYYDELIVEDPTNYSMYLRYDYGDNVTNATHFAGEFMMDVKGYSLNGKSMVDLPRMYGNQSSYTFNETVRYNRFNINYTHQYTDGLWGQLTYQFYWRGDRGFRYAWRPYYLIVLRASLAPPVMSVIDPMEDGRWGVYRINYIVVAAWHSKTSGVYAKLDAFPEQMNLTRLSDAIVNPNITARVAEYGIPQELFDIPFSWRQFYWFYPLTGEELSAAYPDDGSGLSRMTADVWGSSLVGTTVYTSENVSIGFDLVHNTDFQLFPLYDIFVGQKARVKYYCPSGTETIIISLQDESGLNTQLVTIGNGTESVYLADGYQNYAVPFRFTYEGEFHFLVEVYDDLGGYKAIPTNSFKVIEEDSRPWYIRLVDEGIQVMILWTSITAASIGVGVVAIVRKKPPTLSITYVTDKPLHP